MFAVPNFFSKDQLNSFPSFIPKQQVNLGLDLQGGSHLLLEVDTVEIIKERLENLNSDVRSVLKKNNIQYKLWSRKQVEKLLEKPKNKEFKKLYYDFDQDIMRIDFGRYLILWNFGGIYIDLDICIIKNKSIQSLFDKEYFFVKWADDKRSLPYNAVLGTQKETDLYRNILDHCKESYYEKEKQAIYKKWKGRFVFQTTGHYMLQRVLKKHKIKDFLNIMKIHTKSGKVVQGPNPLFEDANASVWYDGK